MSEMDRGDVLGSLLEGESLKVASGDIFDLEHPLAKFIHQDLIALGEIEGLAKLVVLVVHVDDEVVAIGNAAVLFEKLIGELNNARLVDRALDGHVGCITVDKVVDAVQDPLASYW